MSIIYALCSLLGLFNRSGALEVHGHLNGILSRAGYIPGSDVCGQLIVYFVSASAFGTDVERQLRAFPHGSFNLRRNLIIGRIKKQIGAVVGADLPRRIFLPLCADRAYVDSAAAAVQAPVAAGYQFCRSSGNFNQNLRIFRRLTC